MKLTSSIGWRSDDGQKMAYCVEFDTLCGPKSIWIHDGRISEDPSSILAGVTGYHPCKTEPDFKAYMCSKGCEIGFLIIADLIVYLRCETTLEVRVVTDEERAHILLSANWMEK